MKKKQVALLLAALMCITSVAESAAVMGAEFSSGEETVEMQGTEEEAEAEDTAEIWTSGEEVSDFGTDEAPEVDGFTSEESEASTDAAGAKQVKGSFEVAYITEEQYNNALQNEESSGSGHENSRRHYFFKCVKQYRRRKYRILFCKRPGSGRCSRLCGS